jgi:predicted oxidoreductase
MKAVMRSHRALLAGALICGLVAGGCLMPNGGTPVLVDSRAGDFWSGKGLLTEVSPDQKRCKVAIRDSALFVHEMWVECTWVHPRSGRG